MSKPYLSIVIAVRNDNYGGDFTQRLQKSLNWNTRWLEHYGVAAEFVLVNWNPLPEEQSLVERLDWPAERKHVKYRMIDVPNAVHETFVNPDVRDTVPMFEFIAKNAGVRRANGEYILSTNADILIHPKIFKSIANGQLDEAHYYRANRLDYRKTEHDTVSQMFKQGLVVLLKGKEYYYKVERFKKLQYQWFRLRNTLRLKWEATKLRFVAISNRLRLDVVHDNGTFMAHCLSSGDFMLMNKKHWNTLKGYPEYTYTVLHKDSMFTILALSMLKEKVFDKPIFHQDHERRYTWEAAKHDTRYDKAFAFFVEMAHEVRQKRPIEQFLNSEDWGLVDFKLEEQQL